jgi:signal transduction histidine kinase
LRQDLDEVLLASRRAADLVRQILAFSRRQDLPRTATELGHVVSDAVRLLRASLPPNLQIVTSAPDGRLWVRADAS